MMDSKLFLLHLFLRFCLLFTTPYKHTGIKMFRPTGHFDPVFFFQTFRPYFYQAVQPMWLFLQFRISIG